MPGALFGHYTAEGADMKEYYIWVGTVDIDAFHENYWDNEPYEEALQQWQPGSPKPAESLKCGFCRELGLEKLDDDHWFTVAISPCPARQLLELYTAEGLDKFESACHERGVLSGNAIWGLSKANNPNIDPSRLTMTYIGVFEM